MAITASSMTNLDSYYQSLINYTLTQEKVPITRLTTKKDEISVKKGVYADLKSKFSSLQTAINSLRSSQGTFALNSSRAVSVSPAVSGTSVATASVGSSVSAGTYSLSVTTLAKAHEVHSTRQTYADQALGLSGTFVIGGAAERSVSINATTPDRNNIAAVSTDETNTILAGQKELGSGSYSIETRESSGGTWQFRIVDADGIAQTVRSGSSTTATTSSWQAIPLSGTTGGTYDTGRGFSVNFGADSSLFTAEDMSTDGVIKVDYEAKGASIKVTSTMSLESINTAINDAAYASGNEISSAIIDKTLVLKNQATGAAHIMQATDTTGGVLSDLGVLSGGILNTKVVAGNASFTVNGMETMTRSSNTNLTDVVTGMTISLSSDAAGKSADIVVTSNMDTARKTIDAFVSAFNDLNSFVRSKTRTVKNADETYTRGSLVGEQNLRYTSNDLVAVMNQDFANTGIYKNLSEIGITIKSDLSATVSDSEKLSTALNSQYADMTKIMDSVMDAMAARIETYTGTDGYINQSITTAESQLSSLTSRITSMNERVTLRQNSLVKQYSQIQAQMETFLQSSNLNKALYG